MESFLKKLVERTRKMKIGDPFAEDTTVGATISQEQGDKVLRYIELAKSEVRTSVLLHTRQGFPQFSSILDISILYQGV